MKLRIVGAADDILAANVPPGVKRIDKFLRAAPDGEMYFTQTLAARLGVSVHYIQTNGAHPLIADLRHRAALGGTTKLLWGNPRTIAEARKVRAA